MTDVWILKECYFNYCDCFETVRGIVDSEEEALVWKEAIPHTETEFREYEKFTIGVINDNH